MEKNNYKISESGFKKNEYLDCEKEPNFGPFYCFPWKPESDWHPAN